MMNLHATNSRLWCLRSLVRLMAYRIQLQWHSGLKTTLTILQAIDGQGTFHGMGLIAVSVPRQGNFATPEQPVKRLSSKLPVGLSALVADRGIPILSYDRPGRCGLQNVTMTEISELKRLVQVTLPPLAHLDTLWHLKWFFMDTSNLRPNWVGYMQTTCTGAPSVAGVVKMLPVIDMKPTDSSCIYSTLCFVIHQAKQLNIPCHHIWPTTLVESSWDIESSRFGHRQSSRWFSRHEELFGSHWNSNVVLWPPYGIGQAIIFCPVVSFFFLSFFPRLISVAADRMSTILPHMVWP